MDELESNDDRLSEYFVNYFVENYPEFFRRMTWTGIQCHTLPMNSNHACDWYRKRLGLDEPNARNGRERA